MNGETVKPSDLYEVLSITPLLHLIPKQDIAPLITQGQIDTIYDGIDITGTDTNSEANAMRKALKRDPEYLENVVKYLSEEFTNFEDEELDELTFKKPVLNDTNESKVEVDLPPLERKLFDITNDIDDSCIKELKVSFDPSEFDGSRLSVRKNYDIEDPVSIMNHNKVYNKKFQKEYNFMVSMKSKLKEDALSSLQYPIKRPISDSRRNSPEPKRQHRNVNTDSSSSIRKACMEFTSLIRDIENTKSKDIMDQNIWTTFGDSKILSTKVLIKISDYFRRIISNNIISREISIDEIIKIQKYCLPSVQEGSMRNWNEVIDLLKRNEVSEEQISEIKSVVEEVINSLNAANITMQIMISKTNDKRLHLEEYLNSSIQLMHSLVQDLIIPLMNFNFLNTHQVNLLKILFKNIVPEISNLYSMVSTYLERNKNIDDEILTKLEYLSISILYSDILVSKAKGIFSTSDIGSLKLGASNILTIIFKHHPDQKGFILNELFAYIDRIPTNKNLAKQYKLSRGGNVQLITILLLELMQSFDINQYLEDADEIIQLIESKAPIEANKRRKKSLLEKITKLFDQANLLSEEIAYFLTKRLIENPGQQIKSFLENLLEDLLIIFTFPEWPAAEMLLSSLVKNLLRIIQSGNCTIVSESYALEMLGLFGSDILQLKLKFQTAIELTSNCSESDLTYYKTCFDDTLGYVQLQTHKNKTYTSSFRFLLLKYIYLILNTKSPQSDGEPQHEENKDKDTAKDTNSKIERLYDSLLVVVSEDSIKLNRALNSDKDLLSVSYYVSVLLSQGLLNLYDSFLATVIYSLESNKIKSKTRAIKILTSLIDKDPLLLVSPRIQESISKRLLDSSPLVRDAVIDLISQYMNSRPEVIEKFQRPITYRLNDDSVQVRKRVLKISKEMYFRSEEKDTKCHIAAKILRKLDDVDAGIRELAKSTIFDFWFISLLSEIRGQEATSIISSVLKRCEIMMEVVSLGGKNSQYFEQFLEESVIRSKDPEILNCLHLYIDKTLDFIIDHSDTEEQTNVEKALIFITTFVKCDGTLLNQDQLIALQPYIIDRSSSEKMYYYCLEILKYVLPSVKSLRPDFVDPVQSYLLRQLTKFNVVELHEAMPCIWRLCKMKKNSFKLANAAISCIKLLQEFMESSKMEIDDKEKEKLKRLLHLLGCFGTYCKFEDTREIFEKSGLNMKENETVLSFISKFLLFFCKIKFDASIRNVAIMNVMHICGSHPKLFLSDPILKILDRELKGGELSIQYTIVEGIMRFLESEERNSADRNGIDQKSSREIKLDISAFHGDERLYFKDGISTALAQRYFNNVLELCLNDDDKNSLLAAKCLQIIVHLGVANPKLCVPTVIALESSTNPSILRIATDVHNHIYSKYESLTDSCYGKGIKTAIEFRRRVSNNYLHEKQFFNILYSVVRGNFSSRKKFIQSLISMFKFNTNNPDPESNKYQRDSIVFISLNIASLNLASLEEVLLLIDGLDKLILREVMDLVGEVEDRTVDLEPLYLENLSINSQTSLAIMSLRKHLVNTYCISPTQVENFSPHRVDIELRQQPKLVNISPVNLDNIDLDVYKKDGGQSIFNSLISMMNELSH